MNEEKLCIFSGKVSTFGGPSDSGMTKSEGLSLFEHHEANDRSDLFLPRSKDLSLGTSQRLRQDALFFACRFSLKSHPRSMLQATNWLFINERNGAKACLWLVDWGPHVRTDRIFDISVYAASVLGLKTDDIVTVSPFCTLKPLEVV